MSNILNNAYIYFTKLPLKKLEDESKIEKINIIGMYDDSLKIWYNGWSIYDDNNTNNYKKSKDLLLYAINIERDMNGISTVEKAIIKSILINSKFYISEKTIQISVILSLIAYLIKAKNYSTVKSGSLNIYIMEV